MQIPAIAQQMIDIDAQSQKTSLDIATAVAAKQLNAAKQQGEQIVNLIEQSNTSSTPTRGIDVRA